MMHFFQKIRNWITPRYNELMTYQTAIICIMLSIVYPEIRATYRIIVDSPSSGPLAQVAWAMSVIGVVGIGLSIWHVFIWREKTLTEIFFMGAFTMGANGLAGVAAGVEILPGRWSFMVLFPLWNIIMGVISIYQMALVNNAVTDENMSFPEVVSATILLLALFAFITFRLDFTWAMTFSFCMCYASAASFFVPWMKNNFLFQGFSKS